MISWTDFEDLVIGFWESTPLTWLLLAKLA